MGDDDSDRELEREIRAGRSFTMAEALGRLAGPGGTKGASPVNRLQQAQVEVAELVRRHLDDPDGALAIALAREVGEGGILLAGMDDPPRALRAHLDQLIASPPLLAELVRMADMEWGQTMGERPFFEIEGRPPHPHDPYTQAGVRARLERLRAALAPSG